MPGNPLQERVIRGQGTPEDAWRPWLRAQPFTPMSLPALMGEAQRLVVVAPHPDDEVLACGGLLAMQAERGGQVLVIAVTDGEQSHANIAGVDAAALAAQRVAERLEGARRLGFAGDNVIPLRLPDAALGKFAHRLAARLAGLLTRGDLVVSTWRLDGHPDHDASGLATARACASVGCRHIEAPVWMWHWANPADPRVPWHRMTPVPLSERALAAKREALSAHTSQLTARSRHVGPVLDEQICARADRPFEYFLT